MERDDEDEAWRAIVDNYGDRAALGPETAPEQPADPATAGVAWPFEDLRRSAAPPTPDPVDDPEDRFVPPPPAPLPRPPRDRLLAWIGVLGSPTVLLLALLTGLHPPTLLAYLLVCGFVGGFGYLVWQMPRGPRDPWDDGAQV